MQLAGANAQHALLHCLPAAFKPPWRNWLARSAVNRKVGGSSPPGGGKTHFGDTIVLTELAMSRHLQPRTCTNAVPTASSGNQNPGLTRGRRAFYH